MQWEHFIYFAFSSVACWAIAATLAYKPENYGKVLVWTFLGLILFSAFIAGMWLSLERPPLRTMGETRLWYSFFLPVAGLITYMRWKYKWILSFSTLLSLVFICINLFKPEIHNKTLMPALQSPWFAPHVIVYMFAYAVLGAAAVSALYLLVQSGKTEKQPSMIALCDNLVYVGTAFITIGMLFGAIWAKAAWGHYWSWDPKETWAAATWMAYLLYIHFRLHRPEKQKTAFYLLIFAFFLLQICWFGVNYLPSAGNSIHVYS
jgi:ABC-type transport system involved in cytochrome c biogenesis permease subunit